ncbi:MAG: Gfo/Idh/MocA family protein [Planctomycetaceae bacterium]
MSIGIGMIGSGFMGLTYSEVAANHLKGGHLVAIAGGSRAPQLAKDYNVPVESSPEALLARPDIEAVILATPDQYRKDLTIAAAKAGKHVLAEKPMAANVRQCDEMIEACRKAGVNLAVVKTERYRKLTQMAKQIVDEGGIGPVWMMRTISSFPRPLTEDISTTRQWMYDPTSSGLFFGIATHNADFLRWMANANATKVFAKTHTYSDLPGSTHSVMAQIEFENGVMAHMWISSEFPAPGIPSSEVRFQVVGRDGILDIENFEFLDLGKDGKWERIYTPERFDYLKEPKSPIRLYPHIGVIQEFVDSITEKRAPKIGGEQGRAAVEICEACLISSQSGEAVTLPLKS